MQVIYERCCGLAVPKKRGVACVITPEAQQTRTFTAMTQDLLALSDWLMEHRVTHVAMESTAGRRLYTPGGKRSAHQGPPGPQDGCERRGVDRRPAKAWLGQSQLCT